MVRTGIVAGLYCGSRKVKQLKLLKEDGIPRPMSRQWMRTASSPIRSVASIRSEENWHREFKAEDTLQELVGETNQVFFDVAM